jgi:dihydrofolate synthase / folylpolyglutamate synthase
VVRDQAPDALRVVEARCAEVDATLVLEGRDYVVEDRTPGVGGQQFTVRGRFATYEDLYLPMFGDYAARNCATAIAALEALLGRALDRSAVEEAMGATHSPGRLEVVDRHPLVVLDGAHNPAGAEGLAVAMREVFAWDRLHLVIAVSANKDLGGIVAPLAPLADRAYAAANESDRTEDAEVLFEALALRDVAVERFTSVAAALNAARADAAEDDLILVTGSLYTVADARRVLGP